MKEGWNHVLLGNVCQTTSGGTPSRRNPDFYEGNIPWVKSGELNSNYITETQEHISEEAIRNSSAKVFPKGTLLMAMYGATIGKVAILGIEAATNQAVCGIYESEAIETRYLYWFLSSSKSNLVKQGIGGAQPNIGQGIIKNLKIPLPPLPEQRAIVSRIEELFSAVESGVGSLRQAQAQLKVYRQAVLSSVVNGSDLVPINDVIEDLTQGWSPSCINRSSSDPEEWAVIKTSAVQHGRYIDVENKILPENLEPREQHEIEVGDVLITRAGPRVRVGVCCLVRKTRPKLINCDKVYRIRINRELMHPEFFEAVLNSPEYLKAIEKIKTGSSDSGLNLTQNRFLTIEIPLPTLEEQHQIVQEIEKRLSVCDSLEVAITDSLSKAEALRQSILKKAFAGELLTEDELAACRKEKDWEPAGVLVERIKKEKNGKKK